MSRYGARSTLGDGGGGGRMSGVAPILRFKTCRRVMERSLTSLITRWVWRADKSRPDRVKNVL